MPKTPPREAESDEGPVPVPRGNRTPSTNGEDDPAQRVIKVSTAVGCCQRSVARMTAVYEEVARQLLDGIQNFKNEKGEFERFSLGLLPLAPRSLTKGGEAVVPRVIRLPRGNIGGGQALGFAAAMILLDDEVDAYREEGKAAEFAQTIGRITNAVRSAVSTRRDNICEDCMMRAALPQKPQRRRRKTVWTRQ